MSSRNVGYQPESWEARVRAGVEAAVRRREARAAERRAHARRRAHGMIERHAVRLAEARSRVPRECDTG
ncbi:hypothetical protein [Actinoplanes sp. URMC 104]|uniref:hypothetical protein n=1 Tax=Actinoplanes sp. URMC 104 TaxID=3423409 RepID=UPI003F1A11D2